MLLTQASQGPAVANTLDPPTVGESTRTGIHRGDSDLKESQAEASSVLRAREPPLKKAYRESHESRDVVATFGPVVRDGGARRFRRTLVRS